MTQYHYTQPSSPEYARQTLILGYKYWFEMRQNKEEHCFLHSSDEFVLTRHHRLLHPCFNCIKLLKEQAHLLFCQHF